MVSRENFLKYLKYFFQIKFTRWNIRLVRRLGAHWNEPIIGPIVVDDNGAVIAILTVFDLIFKYLKKYFILINLIVKLTITPFNQ